MPYFLFVVICVNVKSKYLSSAFLLLLTSVIVKIIGAVYKIPLTAFIGAVGRGYFAAAYNLCLPIHAITMGVFPVALSRLVSKYNACNNNKKILALKKSSYRMFFVVGLIGMTIMIILSKPYSLYIAHAPKSFYTILVLAPSILFSCLAASYRGYYEGFLNMHPTSVSQTIEAFFKMIFGLVFAKLTMGYLYNIYLQTGQILDIKITSDEQALSVIYPITSAAAMVGVTLGSVVSFLYVFLYYRINREKTKIRLLPSDVKSAGSELFSFSLPIMISCAVQSIFQFLDTATIQYSLGSMDKNILHHSYSQCVSIAGISSEDIVTYVYGLFSSALDFKNLIPGITMAFGVCAVPAISSAIELKNQDKLNTLINSIYKYTVLLSLFGGFLLAGLSKDILTLFYSSSSQDIIIGCDSLVKYFGLTVVTYSLSGTAVFCVQAVGHPEKSILPYIVSGVVRVVLNLALVQNEKLILFGSVISGAVGYFIMAVWNICIARKYSKTKFRFADVIIKPLLLTVVSYMVCEHFIFNHIFLENFFYNLLIKGTFSAGIFCILCTAFKVVDVKDLFVIIKCKKTA